jgi:protein O-mannosyl-transferase
MQRRDQSNSAQDSPAHPLGKRSSADGEQSANSLSAVVCVFLLLAVATVFGQAVTFDFVDFDDSIYVYANPELARGLSPDGIAWAFTATRCANWHPLTWLSLLLDHQLYGQKPWGYHVSNVLLHAATAVLLFLVLRRMTADLWVSAFVAAVFAIHPLRAESVAWVAERKDVLSGLFFMLTLAAYVGYVRRPFSLARYVSVAALFALGLMAKPMLVTLPFVLLLLDYWPLGRMTWPAKGGRSNATSWAGKRTAIPSGWGGSCTATPATPLQPSPQGTNSLACQLVVEKLPLLALSAVSCVVTARAQAETVAPLDLLPLASRVANTLVAYVSYVGQFFCPAQLAAFYPYPLEGLPLWQVAGALLLLATVTTGVAAYWRQWPWLLVGWFWYLGMLVPVIGLMQVGHQSMADRYTYLPQIGLTLGLACAVKQALASWPHRGRLCGVAAALLLAILMGCAWRQASFWHDSETLWQHAIDCMPRNAAAHANLASALAHDNRIDEAMDHFTTALKIRPDVADVHYNFGLALVNCGRIDEGIAQYHQALDIRPDYAEAHNNLGLALAKRGRSDEALSHYRKAVEIEPAHANAHYNIGLILAERGQLDDAIAQYQLAAKLNPEDAETYNNLGNALIGRGRIEDAIADYQIALQFDANNANTHNNLGIALAGRGRIDEAVVHYQKALELAPNSAGTHNNLGILLAGRNRVDEAIAHYTKALELMPDYAAAHNNLGMALTGRGCVDEAIAHFRRALELKADYAAARKNLDAALSQRNSAN